MKKSKPKNFQLLNPIQILDLNWWYDLIITIIIYLNQWKVKQFMRFISKNKTITDT